MAVTLIVVEDSKAWSGWHGDNLIIHVHNVTLQWWIICNQKLHPEQDITTRTEDYPHPIPEFSKPLRSATCTLHRIFYCVGAVARIWVVIGCQRDLLLLGRLLLMNLRHTQCKLCLSRDPLVKGLQNLIIIPTSPIAEGFRVCQKELHGIWSFKTNTTWGHITFL